MKNCAWVEARFEAWLAESLTADEVRVLEAHAAGCAACRELLDLGRAAAATEAAAPNVVAGVLERTSGPACAGAEARLPAWIDGDLAPADAALVEGHVAACGPCEALAAELRRLALELPAMATATPPAGFVAGVLARTTREVAAPEPSRRGRWATLGRRWLARPRFAFELAYVATALLVVLSGLPAGAGAPEAAAELLRQPVQGIGRVMGRDRSEEALEVVRDGAEAAVEGTQSALELTDEGLRTFWRGLASLLQRPDGEEPGPGTEHEETP